jgi:hypothetical protein
MPGSVNNQPTKEMPCRECGKPMTVNAQTSSSPRCFECGLAAYVESRRQLAAKSGTVYEKMRAAQRLHPRGKGRGGGLNK